MQMPKIQLRHDTAANWASVNPVLLAGEVGIELSSTNFVDYNYEPYGNITNNQGVLSGFSYDVYAYITPKEPTTYNTVTFTTKVNFSSYNPNHDDIISCTKNVRPIGFSNGYLGIWNGSDWQYGNTQYQTNTDIWVRAIHTNGIIYIYGLIDNGYTFHTLPDISNWTLETQWDTGEGLSYHLLIGRCWLGNSEATAEYFNGSIDLNETYVYCDDTKVYEGRTLTNSSKVKIGDGTTVWNNLGYVIGG